MSTSESWEERAQGPMDLGHLSVKGLDTPENPKATVGSVGSTELERPAQQQGTQGGSSHRLTLFLSSSRSLWGWVDGLSRGAWALWGQPQAVSVMAGHSGGQSLQTWGPGCLES